MEYPKKIPQSLYLHLRLIRALAFGRIQLTEQIQLVHGGQRNEQQVPHHQHDAEAFVQLPAVQMDRSEQKDNGRQQRHCRVEQTWRMNTKFGYLSLRARVSTMNRVVPLEITFTCPPGLMMVVCMNHGRPKQIRMSNTFEPTAFETAISP